MNDNKLQNNDNNQQQTELENTISNLPDLAPQVEVKGGTSHTAGRCSCGQEHPSGGGGFINNHNETVANDEASVLDLEPIGEIKGGPVMVEYGIQVALINPSAPTPTASGHSGGVNACLLDGSVR